MFGKSMFPGFFSTLPPDFTGTIMKILKGMENSRYIPFAK